MKRLRIRGMLLVVAVAGVCIVGSAGAGSLRAWGSDSDGQVTQLPSGSSFTAVAAGDSHGLALRPDGTIAAWGQNDDGECRVPTGTFRAIGAGADFSLAIRTNGTIAAWGSDADGVISRVPAGTSYTAVEGGLSFAVALGTDGSIVAWGDDRSGQVSGAPRGSGFKAVVAGDSHGLALRSDGSLVSWGSPQAIQGMPTSGTFTAIGAGGAFCVALKSDGSLVWWGYDPYRYGLAQVPAGNDYTAVSAGYLHCLALKKDGSVVGWGAGVETSSQPNLGQAKPPAGRDCVAVAAGLFYSLALVGQAAQMGIADDFDDGTRGSLWKFYGADQANCWLDEVNRRLELRATAKARVTPAYYLSSGWQLDPAQDFSFKVTYFYGLVTEKLGWVSVGLTPNEKDLNGKHVEFGPGCGKYYRHVWWEAVDGDRTQVDFADRREEDSTLYVSYNAASDKLYLSTTGYGERYAWGVVPGLLRGSWGGRPILLYLGGGSDGLEIKSGDAYLDNFIVETGGTAGAVLSDVHRFWSPTLRRHFYTIDLSEKDKLVTNYPKVWTYEGPVFKVAATQDSTGLAPVYRFWSLKGQGHFYTIDPAEKNLLLDKYSRVWAFEGVAFYAYPEGKRPAASKPVYRFWRPKDNGHFYTISTSERDLLIKNYPRIYTLEGVAFYAYE